MTTTADNAEKKKKSPLRWRKWRYILPLLLLSGAGFIFWLLAGFSIHLPSPQERTSLEAARQAWSAQGIKNYRLRVSTYDKPLWITVQDGQVERVEQSLRRDPARNPLTYEESRVRLIEKDEQPELYFAFLPVDAHELTVESVFDYADRMVIVDSVSIISCWQNARRDYSIHYDESLSYIDDISLSYCQDWNFGAGILCPGTATDCSTGFSVDSLETLPEKP